MQHKSDCQKEVIPNSPNTIEGNKNDFGKLRYDLFPYDAMEEITKVLTFGANKYAPRNWERGLKFSRCFAAAQRHLTTWFQFREDEDNETGLNHLAHASCCLLFMLSQQLRSGYSSYDDRPNVVKDVPISVDME